jgi:hypothetical protein
MIHVGYRRMLCRAQRSGRASRERVSHSTYGMRLAADPNRAFWSVHAGQVNPPYMITPLAVR